MKPKAAGEAKMQSETDSLRLCPKGMGAVVGSVALDKILLGQNPE